MILESRKNTKCVQMGRPEEYPPSELRGPKAGIVLSGWMPLGSAPGFR